MCGIVGIAAEKPVATELYDSLIHLQHRGQDAAGILTCDQRFYLKHGLGLVREVFSPDDMQALQGHMGIAHTRYPTAGGYSLADVQPLWIGSPLGIAMAHNGNLTNYRALAQEITQKQHRHLNSAADSEVLLHLFADGLDQAVDNPNFNNYFEKICHAVSYVCQRAQGAFSVVGLIVGQGLIAFRDPHGIRPLVMGERVNAEGRKEYIFASENTMFYALGFQAVGDLQPGEVVFVNRDGQLFRRVVTSKSLSPCIFEYVYFARPDAKLDEVSVYRARLRMGQNLAKRWKEQYPDLLPDIVIPAPSTANTAALSFAHELGVRYSEGLYKNPFIGRTFIMPDCDMRERSVRYKLTPQETEIRDKKVLIVDDSIVRGTTSREIIKMVREFGAQAIYFVSSCPPLRFPCVYGIDIPTRAELIAARLNGVEAIRTYLGVDQLLYQTQEDLVEAVTRRGAHNIQRPCMACMDGNYVAGDMNEQRLAELECTRLQEKNKGKGTKCRQLAAD